MEFLKFVFNALNPYHLSSIFSFLVGNLRILVSPSRSRPSAMHLYHRLRGHGHGFEYNLKFGFVSSALSIAGNREKVIWAFCVRFATHRYSCCLCNTLRIFLLLDRGIVILQRKHSFTGGNLLEIYKEIWEVTFVLKPSRYKCIRYIFAVRKWVIWASKLKQTERED